MSLPVIVFFLVYLGMALGRVPGLALDRTGIALLGIIVLIGTETMTLAEAASADHGGREQSEVASRRRHRSHRIALRPLHQ